MEENDGIAPIYLVSSNYSGALYICEMRVFTDIDKAWEYYDYGNLSGSPRMYQFQAGQGPILLKRPKKKLKS